MRRLIAGCWFAATGIVSGAISFLAVRSWELPITQGDIIIYVILPTMMSALCGATIGAQILSKPPAQRSKSAAVVRGAIVGTLSFLVFVLSLEVAELSGVEGPKVILFFGFFLYIMLIWGWFWFLIYALPGIASGLLLLSFSKRRSDSSNGQNYVSDASRAADAIERTESFHRY
jgi:hypothetical protein